MSQQATKLSGQLPKSRHNVRKRSASPEGVDAIFNFHELDDLEACDGWAPSTATALPAEMALRQGFVSCGRQKNDFRSALRSNCQQSSASCGAGVAGPLCGTVGAPTSLAPSMDKERLALVRAAFCAYDADGDGRLDRRELRRFATHAGFEGDDEAWAREYTAICRECGAEPDFGLRLKGFRKLVDDPSSRGIFCGTEELREMLNSVPSKVESEGSEDLGHDVPTKDVPAALGVAIAFCESLQLRSTLLATLPEAFEGVEWALAASESRSGALVAQSSSTRRGRWHLLDHDIHGMFLLHALPPGANVLVRALARDDRGTVRRSKWAEAATLPLPPCCSSDSHATDVFGRRLRGITGLCSGWLCVDDHHVRSASAARASPDAELQRCLRCGIVAAVHSATEADAVSPSKVAGSLE